MKLHVIVWVNINWLTTQVVYQAGVNEKLLGDFIRKHNVRDKIFRMCGVPLMDLKTY
jgi:hypothetical protein